MTTQHTTREVIENKLLTALQDEGTAAILVSADDLSVMIRALEYAMLSDREQTRKARELATDYRKLLKAAFPEANDPKLSDGGACHGGCAGEGGGAAAVTPGAVRWSAWLAALRLAVAEQRAARAAYDARDKSAIVGSVLEMALLSNLDAATRHVARVAEGMADAGNDKLTDRGANNQ